MVPRQLRWQAFRLLQRKNMSREELRQGLAEAGIHLSYSQVCRILKESPGRISISLIEALVQVLECTPGELFREPPPKSSETISSIKPDIRASRFDFPFELNDGRNDDN